MTTDEKVRMIAGVCHEANRAYCYSLDDGTQPTWQDAPEWQRTSAIEGVKGALKGATPEQSHEGWLALKEAEGWTYGEVKDPQNKKHPCMVPYAELPESQRLKDELFLGIVDAMAKVLIAPLDISLLR